MRIDRLINVLSEITLIEMMVTIGLGMTFSDVLPRKQELWAGRARRTGKLHFRPCGSTRLTPVVSRRSHDRGRTSRRRSLPGGTLWATFHRDGQGKCSRLGG